VATRFTITSCDKGENLKAQLSDIGRADSRPTFWVKTKLADGREYTLELLVNGLTANNGTGDGWLILGVIPLARQAFKPQSLWVGPEGGDLDLVPDGGNELHFTGYCNTRYREGYLDITGSQTLVLRNNGSFNVNGYVWVSLNQFGRTRYLEHYQTSGISEAAAKAQLENAHEDDSDFIRLQLHELMHIFGSAMDDFFGNPFTNCELYFRRP